MLLWTGTLHTVWLNTTYSMVEHYTQYGWTLHTVWLNTTHGMVEHYTKSLLYGQY